MSPSIALSTESLNGSEHEADLITPPHGRPQMRDRMMMRSLRESLTSSQSCDNGQESRRDTQCEVKSLCGKLTTTTLTSESSDVPVDTFFDRRSCSHTLTAERTLWYKVHLKPSWCQDLPESKVDVKSDLNLTHILRFLINSVMNPPGNEPDDLQPASSSSADRPVFVQEQPRIETVEDNSTSMEERVELEQEFAGEPDQASTETPSVEEPRISPSSFPEQVPHGESTHHQEREQSTLGEDRAGTQPSYQAAPD